MTSLSLLAGRTVGGETLWKKNARKMLDPAFFSFSYFPSQILQEHSRKILCLFLR